MSRSSSDLHSRHSAACLSRASVLRRTALGKENLVAFACLSRKGLSTVDVPTTGGTVGDDRKPDRRSNNCQRVDTAQGMTPDPIVKTHRQKTFVVGGATLFLAGAVAVLRVGKDVARVSRCRTVTWQKRRRAPQKNGFPENGARGLRVPKVFHRTCCHGDSYRFRAIQSDVQHTVPRKIVSDQEQPPSHKLCAS